MNDEDLYGPKLTLPPATSPVARGAVVLVTVSLAVGGCVSMPIGRSVPVNDAGLSIPVDAANVDAGASP